MEDLANIVLVPVFKSFIFLIKEAKYFVQIIYLKQFGYKIKIYILYLPHILTSIIQKFIKNKVPTTLAVTSSIMSESILNGFSSSTSLYMKTGSSGMWGQRDPTNQKAAVIG